jgi:hypothetical protein
MFILVSNSLLLCIIYIIIACVKLYSRYVVKLPYLIGAKVSGIRTVGRYIRDYPERKKQLDDIGNSLFY